MISTRGRYALRFLVDLAECQGEGFTALKDIASRQEISQKYAERLLAMLSDKNIVDAKHGKGGGYKLNREPKDYKISEILTAMGEELAPVGLALHHLDPVEAHEPHAAYLVLIPFCGVVLVVKMH